MFACSMGRQRLWAGLPWSGLHTRGRQPHGGPCGLPPSAGGPGRLQARAQGERRPGHRLGVPRAISLVAASLPHSRVDSGNLDVSGKSDRVDSGGTLQGAAWAIGHCRCDTAGTRDTRRRACRRSAPRGGPCHSVSLGFPSPPARPRPSVPPALAPGAPSLPRSPPPWRGPPGPGRDPAEDSLEHCVPLGLRTLIVPSDNTVCSPPTSRRHRMVGAIKLRRSTGLPELTAPREGPCAGTAASGQF